MLAAAVGVRGEAFTYEPPREVLLFQSMNLSHAGGPYLPYAVSPDPKRLLVFQRFLETTATTTTSTGPDTGADATSGLMVILHWETTLKAGKR
jgi:hypothetical protein